MVDTRVIWRRCEHVSREPDGRYELSGGGVKTSLGSPMVDTRVIWRCEHVSREPDGGYELSGGGVNTSLGSPMVDTRVIWRRCEHVSRESDGGYESYLEEV